MSFPADILGEIAEDTNSDFIIKSRIASVVFDERSIEAINEEDPTGNISLVLKLLT